MFTCPYCQFEIDEHALACPNYGKAIASPRDFDLPSEKAKALPNSDQLGRRTNQLALWSTILGGPSFPPSVLYLSLMIDAMNSPGGGSDFQGAIFQRINEADEI